MFVGDTTYRCWVFVPLFHIVELCTELSPNVIFRVVLNNQQVTFLVREGRKITVPFMEIFAGKWWDLLLILRLSYSFSHYKTPVKLSPKAQARAAGKLLPRCKRGNQSLHRQRNFLPCECHVIRPHLQQPPQPPSFLRIQDSRIPPPHPSIHTKTGWYPLVFHNHSLPSQLKHLNPLSRATPPCPFRESASERTRVLWVSPLVPVLRH